MVIAPLSGQEKNYISRDGTRGNIRAFWLSSICMCNSYCTITHKAYYWQIPHQLNKVQISIRHWGEHDVLLGAEVCVRSSNTWSVEGMKETPVWEGNAAGQQIHTADHSTCDNSQPRDERKGIVRSEPQRRAAESWDLRNKITTGTELVFHLLMKARWSGTVLISVTRGH